METSAPPADAAFWGEDPNVLFDSHYAAEFFPVDSMGFNRRLNAVTRVVLVLTAVSFAMTRNLRLLAVSAMTLVAVFVLHRVEADRASARAARPREGFGARRAARPAYQPPTAQNPFANVLPTDYDDPAGKLPAAPPDDPAVAEQVLAATRRLIENANPGQPDIAAKLFHDLGEQLSFEQSMRPFHSTASTTIPNDQGAFLDFCYGDMASCKDGNAFACARATVNHAMI